RVVEVLQDGQRILAAGTEGVADPGHGDGPGLANELVDTLNDPLVGAALVDQLLLHLHEPPAVYEHVDQLVGDFEPADELGSPWWGRARHRELFHELFGAALILGRQLDAETGKLNEGPIAGGDAVGHELALHTGKGASVDSEAVAQ